MTENKFVKLLGFASGNYYCKCRECGDTFTGDKRATQCLPCAANQAAVLLKQYETKYRNGELVYKKTDKPDTYTGRLTNLEVLVQKQGEEIRDLMHWRRNTESVKHDPDKAFWNAFKPLPWTERRDE